MLEKYAKHFTEARWEELCALVAEKGMKISSKDFTVSEQEFIINETPLSENERKGALLYYVKHDKQNIIAMKMNYSESTIKYHKKRVSKAIRETCCRIFK